MAEQREVHIAIPEGVTIDALGLSRDPKTGDIRFDWGPIEQICDASGIDVSLLRDQDEGNVAGLIIAWYGQHLQHNGERNAVLDQLLAEQRVEAAINDERAEGRWTP